jgi:hypothetical protein
MKVLANDAQARSDLWVFAQKVGSTRQSLRDCCGEESQPPLSLARTPNVATVWRPQSGWGRSIVVRRYPKLDKRQLIRQSQTVIWCIPAVRNVAFGPKRPSRHNATNSRGAGGAMFQALPSSGCLAGKSTERATRPFGCRLTADSVEKLQNELTAKYRGAPV